MSVVSDMLLGADDKDTFAAEILLLLSKHHSYRWFT